MAAGIPREEKNQMRKNLEDVLNLQKEIEKKIEAYQKDAVAEEYQKFWKEFRSKNRQTVNYLSNYMVRKANR